MVYLIAFSTPSLVISAELGWMPCSIYKFELNIESFKEMDLNRNNLIKDDHLKKICLSINDEIQLRPNDVVVFETDDLIEWRSGRSKHYFPQGDLGFRIDNNNFII